MNTLRTVTLVVATVAILIIVAACAKKSRPPRPAGPAFRAGFNGDFWSDNAIKAQWQVFENAGPKYSIPIKRHVGASAVPGCRGTLYAALYSRDDFSNLIEFAIYQFYSSSIQQVLLQTGGVDPEWFVPESPDDGTAGVRRWLDHIMRMPEGGDLPKTLGELNILSDLAWVRDFEFTAWSCSSAGGSLEIIAQSPRGYLTIFTVAD